MIYIIFTLMKSAVNTAGAENFEKKFGSFLFEKLKARVVILHKLNRIFFAAALTSKCLAFKADFPYTLAIIHLTENERQLI